MAKSLTIKIGTYTNNEGQEKGNYVRLGTLMQGQDGGEYLIIDPTVSLAGCLTRQNMMNHKAGKPIRDSLMVSIFDNSQQQAPQQQAPQQQAPQNQLPNQASNQAAHPFMPEDSIPF